MSIIRARRRRARCLVLQDVPWRTYSRLLKVFAERPQVRLTYDRGTLAIMSPLYEHDGDVEYLGRLVVTLTEELGLPLRPAGSTTLRQKLKRRGLEPDRAYWITRAAQMVNKRQLDLDLDPPPDLAIEVNVTHHPLDRMSIYAALGVPEVWNLDGGFLTFHALDSTGAYQQLDHSLVFPQLTPSVLLGFLLQMRDLDNNAVIQQFRAWIRQQGWSNPKAGANP